MSTTWRAKVICGFRMTVKNVEQEITKYNEDTGIPYKKKVVTHRAAYVKNVLVADSSQEPDFFDMDKPIEGMNHESFHSYNSDERWLGKEIANVDQYEDFVNLDARFQVPEEVQTFSQKTGIKPEWMLYMGSI